MAGEQLSGPISVAGPGTQANSAEWRSERFLSSLFAFCYIFPTTHTLLTQNLENYLHKCHSQYLT